MSAITIKTFDNPVEREMPSRFYAFTLLLLNIGIKGSIEILFLKKGFS